jgi:hypothetical protein
MFGSESGLTPLEELILFRCPFNYAVVPRLNVSVNFVLQELETNERLLKISHLNVDRDCGTMRSHVSGVAC